MAETKIHKKSSADGLITTYIGKRDYVDQTTHTDPIDGVVRIDSQHPQDKKVYMKLVCAFRYGREDLDVIGLTYRKDFVSKTVQVYPPLKEEDKLPKTPLQEKLVQKIGEESYPFLIEIPSDAPCSVTLQPDPNDKSGKPCGVDYVLTTYAGEEEEDKSNTTIRFALRKVQYAIEKKGSPPSVEVQKEFLMSEKPLSLKASLNKELYYHGETINVSVLIVNNSTKVVKNIEVSVEQNADICLFAKTQYQCTVASVDANDQVAPNSRLCKVYQICPQVTKNKDKCGLALAGKMKHQDTNLASTTIINEGVDKEKFGIVVNYKVKVKVILGILAGEVCAELPFSLMYPKPEASS